MKNIKIILLLLLTLLLCGCGSKEKEKLKELTISFDGNPSTGYIWESETYNEGTVKIAKDYKIECSDNNTECNTKTIFTITPLREGSEVIDFSYVDASGEDEKYNATYYITVDENLNINNLNDEFIELQNILNKNNFVFIDNIALLDEQNIDMIITDKYNLESIKLTKEDLDINTLENTMNDILTLINYENIKMSNLSLKDIEVYLEMQNINFE